MSVIVDVVINTDQAEQQLQDLQQQMADDLAAGAAQMGQAAGRAAGATARAAGKNATEEFLRAFDPDKLRAELESAGLGEQEIEIILETTAAKAETQKLKDSIAGALSEASGLAEDQLKQITAQVAREVDRAAGKVKSVTEIVDGVRDLKGEIQGLGAAGDAAAEGIGQLVLNETVDKFGDLKDIFEKTGVALLGFSQEAVDAAVKAADIAEKGALVGAAFGPMGAAIGLVAGGILGAFNASAEAAAAKAKELADKVTETTDAIKSIGEAAASGGQSIDQLTELQAKLSLELATKTYPALAQFETAQKDVALATQKLAEEEKKLLTEQEGQIGVSSRLQSVQETLTILRQEQTVATNKLKEAEKALAAAKEASLLLDFQLGRSAEQTIGDLREQYKELTQGSDLSRMSTKELTAEVARLDAEYNALIVSAESLSKRSFLKGEGGTSAADEAKAATEAFAKLSEATAVLESRKNANSSATAASTKVAKEETKQIAEKALVVEATNPIYKELVDLEREHYNILLRKAKVERGDILDLGYLEDPIDAANQAAKNAEAAGKDLMTLLEADGRSVEQKVQDKIDALREAKEQAAKEMQQQLTEKGLADLAKAQQEAAKANVEEYKKILQPYTEFIGTVFTDFTNGMLAGQSATEAFAEATRKAIASALGSLAKELGVKSLASLAEGFAALSNPFTAAAAPGFFKASALYAAAAAAAGLGSSVLSTAGANSGASGLGAAGGGAAGTAAAGNTSTSLGRAAQETGAPAPIVIDLRGAMFPTADLTAAQSFGEAVARSLAAASAGNQPMARRMFGSRGFVV